MKILFHRFKLWELDNPEVKDNSSGHVAWLDRRFRECSVELRLEKDDAGVDWRIQRKLITRSPYSRITGLEKRSLKEVEDDFLNASPLSWRPGSARGVKRGTIMDGQILPSPTCP